MNSDMSVISLTFADSWVCTCVITEFWWFTFDLCAERSVCKEYTSFCSSDSLATELSLSY